MGIRRETTDLVDRDKCVVTFPGGQFHMILAGAARAHEIQRARLKAQKKSEKMIKYAHSEVVQSLLDIQAGHVGMEYLETEKSKTHK